ncbi:unnamed protein product [Pleuronectes platessa]|uniref:Uncharacterized protein n=1 Tax=Pleuronectes platessa TaxID=8262 RepID=A0A9N7Z3A1_PLEPL|nr:unnamed protein product [Pleuronectes platessa]
MGLCVCSVVYLVTDVMNDSSLDDRPAAQSRELVSSEELLRGPTSAVTQILGGGGDLFNHHEEAAYRVLGNTRCKARPAVHEGSGRQVLLKEKSLVDKSAAPNGLQDLFTQ